MKSFQKPPTTILQMLSAELKEQGFDHVSPPDWQEWVIIPFFGTTVTVAIVDGDLIAHGLWHGIGSGTLPLSDPQSLDVLSRWLTEHKRKVIADDQARKERGRKYRNSVMETDDDGQAEGNAED